MKSPVVKRSIVVAGHKTSVSLEDAFWKGLKEIADDRDMTLSDLVSSIDTDRQQGNLSSAIRLFVLDHFRNSCRRRRRRCARPDRHAGRGVSSARRLAPAARTVARGGTALSVPAAPRAASATASDASPAAAGGRLSAGAIAHAGGPGRRDLRAPAGPAFGRRRSTIGCAPTVAIGRRLDWFRRLRRRAAAPSPSHRSAWIAARPRAASASSSAGWCRSCASAPAPVPLSATSSAGRTLPPAPTARGHREQRIERSVDELTVAWPRSSAPVSGMTISRSAPARH